MPLKRIPRVLSPELLGCLAAMGHGDEILIADANFPSHAQGAKHVIHCDGSSATQILAAIVELLPLDSFVTHPAAVMKRVDSDEDAPIIAEFQKILDAEYFKDGSKTPVSLERVERFAFYDRAKSVFAVCVTGESRLYGNIIVKKGVIGDDGHTVLQSTNVSVSGKEAPSKRLKAINISDRAKPDAKAKKVTSNAIETKTSGSQDDLPLEAAPSTRPKRNVKVDSAATNKVQASTVDQGKTASPQVEPTASGKAKSVEKALDAKVNEETPNKRAKISKKAGSETDEEREADQQDDDGTITLFSVVNFQQQSLTRRKEQEEEKNKKTRRSLNSLSAQQQFELALKRSLTETSKESKEG